jgi:hypothetical protein
MTTCNHHALTNSLECSEDFMGFCQYSTETIHSPCSFSITSILLLVTLCSQAATPAFSEHFLLTSLTSTSTSPNIDINIMGISTIFF